MIRANVVTGEAVPSTEFRNAMRQLAGGVCVITVGRGADISGMTVTSVSSLSIEPAAVTVNVNRNSSSWLLMQRYGIFGVNVLGFDHGDVAKYFSGQAGIKGAARYVGSNWIMRETGVRLLADAPVSLECEIEQAVEYASHSIVIGRTLSTYTVPHRGALVYWSGDYIELPPEGQGRRDRVDGLPANVGTQVDLKYSLVTD
jgi:flavin reductase (DIM6/NTAB) family NADH-FMN oxidoreductase RutF